VTIANGCSEEERQATPRFCLKPQVANPPQGKLTNLLTGVTLAGRAVGSVAGAAAEVAKLKEKTSKNSAQAKRLGEWFHAKIKGLEKDMRAGYGEWLGRANDRYAKLRQQLFEEVEAAELVHSISYQTNLSASGADSTKRKQFDRHAVTIPCVDFDPEKEFDLKYTWSEKSLTLAQKAQKFGGETFTSGKGFRVKLRGVSVLHVSDAQNAWTKSSAYVRAAALGAAMPEFVRSQNPFMEDMSGAFSFSDERLKATDLNGFSATFACGTRQEMHDGKEGSFPSFAACVRHGAEFNGPHRSEQPGKTFFPDEVVVMVSFAPLDNCLHGVVMGQENAAAEMDNPVYKNFAELGGCTSLPESLPKALAQEASASTYRGMLLGKGLPQETLLEVLIDPEVFLEEIKL